MFVQKRKIRICLLLAAFILQTYNGSGRLFGKAWFCSSFNSFRIETGERRIIRLDELNRLSSSRRIMRLHIERRAIDELNLKTSNCDTISQR